VLSVEISYMVQSSTLWLSSQAQMNVRSWKIIKR
jgi:hypothetical protein